VFARLADGNERRVRAIEGQATMLGRTMHAIAYDPMHDEITVPQQFGQGILVFDGSAKGEQKPTRVINGPLTQLIAPDRLAVDPVGNEIFVPEGAKVLVFPREANGNVAPTRVLTGPDTRIGAARAVAIDSSRDLLIVVSSPPGSRGERTIELTIFDRKANGNAKPRRVISGLTSSWNVTVHPPRGLIFVVQRGYVGVWSIDDDGKTAPRYTIGGPNGSLEDPRGVTIDSKNEAVIVSDKQLNAVLTYHVPQMLGTTSEPQARR
jgi:DNA-binding beta-propeller fold protein YncE